MGTTVALGPDEWSWKYKVMVVVLSLDASECEHMNIITSNDKESLEFIGNTVVIMLSIMQWTN